MCVYVYITKQIYNIYIPNNISFHIFSISLLIFHVSGANKSVDAVITDGSCSPDIIEQADSQNIPLSSSEWVIQCLIHGQKVAFDGHEKFAYNYEEND